MKNLYLAAFLFLISSIINSQSRLENKHFLSLGLGAGTTAGAPYVMFFTLNDDFEKDNSSVFHIKYEYRFADKFWIALSIGHVELRGSWKGSNSEAWINFSDPNAGHYKVSSTSVIARFNWNILQGDKLDLYFGSGVGYRFDSYYESVVNSGVYGRGDSGLSFPISMEASFGIRYYLTPNFGLYSEIGLAKSFFQAGLVVGF